MTQTINATVLATLSTSIGARFDNGMGANETSAATVNVVWDTLTSQDDINNAIGFLLVKGLYSFAAEIKTKNKPETEDEFKDIMHEIDAKMILIASTSESKRGRAASEYPQAMRALDYKIIKRFQFRMLDHDRLIKLPRNFEEWIKPSVLAKVDINTFNGYIPQLMELVNATDFEMEPGERIAIQRLTNWMIESKEG